MRGIELTVAGDAPQALAYEYRSRTIQTPGAHAVSARIPQIQTRVRLQALDTPAALGRAIEGYLFNPYYTLTLEMTLRKGEKTRTCLSIEKM
jgi:hypothetical protein